MFFILRNILRRNTDERNGKSKMTKISHTNTNAIKFDRQKLYSSEVIPRFFSLLKDLGIRDVKNDVKKANINKSTTFTSSLEKKAH